MKSRLAILLALVVVFAAGAASGWAYGQRDGRTRAMRPPRPEDMQKRALDGLQRDLVLTPEQVAKIQPIVTETVAKISELHRSNGRQMKETVKAQNLRIKEFLTETQWTKLQELETHRWKRPSGGTNSPPDGMRPPGPPPDNGPPHR